MNIGIVTIMILSAINISNIGRNQLPRTTEFINIISEKDYIDIIEDTDIQNIIIEDEPVDSEKTDINPSEIISKIRKEENYSEEEQLLIEEDQRLSEIDIISNDDTPLGPSGRWYIPSLDINVAITAISAADNVTAQAVTDAQDSAVYTEWAPGFYYVADHWNQNNYVNISNCTIGTRAYMKTANGIIEYVCTEVAQGYNTEYELILQDGRNAENTGHEILCYTCNGNWQNIWMAFFDKA